MTAGHLSSTVTSIQLDTATDSKISNINLYSSRAEISRIYEFAIAQGVNRLIICNLPDVLENETLSNSTTNPTHQSRTTKPVPKYKISHLNLPLSFTYHYMTIVPYTTQATPSKHYSYTIPPPTTLSYTVIVDPHILLPYIMHVAAQYPLDTRAS